MTVGICGLGLIGGSMAKAYKAQGHAVYGYDKNAASLGYAMLDNICDDELRADNITKCDILFIALYPEAAIEYLENTASLISKNTVVIDLCGTKKSVCALQQRFFSDRARALGVRSREGRYPRTLSARCRDTVRFGEEIYGHRP
jgi:prephenate dehydrogenase